MEPHNFLHIQHACLDWASWQACYYLSTKLPGILLVVLACSTSTGMHLRDCSQAGLWCFAKAAFMLKVILPASKLKSKISQWSVSHVCTAACSHNVCSNFLLSAGIYQLIAISAAQPSFTSCCWTHHKYILILPCNQGITCWCATQLPTVLKIYTLVASAAVLRTSSENLHCRVSRVSARRRR